MDTDSQSPIRTLVWTDPVTVDRSASLRELSARLTEYGIGVAVVRDGPTSVGVVSERDVVASIAEGGDPDVVTVGDVMSRDVIGVPPDVRVFDVALRMVDENLRHLAVEEGGEIVGIVSIKDVTRVVTEDLLATWE
jgi:CBS domain-containing protein